jgi:hypothetical protein
MIAGHLASPTTSPLCSRRPAILGETSMRRTVDPAHLPPASGLMPRSLKSKAMLRMLLAAQHPGGGLLDRLGLGWLDLLTDDATSVSHPRPGRGG